MIYYSPVTGDPPTGPVNYAPCTCFLMTRLGRAGRDIRAVRARVEAAVRENGFRCIDASSVVTGRDFLEKIWKLLLQVPLGIALIDEGFPPSTLANIFYELGMMQAYGKETLVVKTANAEVPSDFIRTEYVELDDHFEPNLKKFFEYLNGLAKHYATMAAQLGNNPFLAIDYLRRAYLLTNNEQFRRSAQQIFNRTPLEGRAQNSVEFLFADFCRHVGAA